MGKHCWGWGGGGCTNIPLLLLVGLGNAPRLQIHKIMLTKAAGVLRMEQQKDESTDSGQLVDLAASGGPERGAAVGEL